MARMYPNELKEITVSTAEYHLYHQLRDQLDEQYVVFHSVAWQAIGRNGRPQDGEADFVIAHPTNGILVIEVKGGAVTWQPQTKQWFSTSAGGRKHIVKDPFEQARVAKYTLLTLLGQAIGETRHINIGHAVAFPEAYVPDEPLGADKPRAIVLDMADTADLPTWTRQAMRYWRGEQSRKQSAAGENGMLALLTLLGRTRELRPVLWGAFQRERQEMIKLTHEQFFVLNMLNRQRQAAIAGVAGSGKTLLAAEKATRLAAKGFRVLLTCYNKNLSHFLQQHIGDIPNLHITHFHKLCFDMARQADLVPLQGKNRLRFYTEQLPEALLDASDHTDTRYDAIIVDEGQDFHDNWWLPLQSLMADPDDGILYIFFDDNQQIYRWQARTENSDQSLALYPFGSASFPIKTEPFMLTINCRNTQSIHDQVTRFYQTDTPVEARGPVGRPVSINRYANSDSLQATLTDTVRRLTHDEKIPPNEIAILTPLSRKKSHLWLTDGFRGIHYTDQWPADDDEIHCNTIHAFKGLESTVVILAEVDQWSRKMKDLDPLLYVACSRARNHLVVLMPDDAPASLQRRFA